MRKILILAAVLALSACGKKEQTITVKDGDGTEKTVKVGQDDGVTTIKTEDGSATFKEGSDGAAFPAFAPQYPGSTVMGSANFSSNKDGGGTGQMVTLQTDDDAATVMAFYKDKVKAAGAQTAMETTTPEGGMIMVKGANAESGTIITVSKGQDGKTTIAYMGGHKGG